MDPSDRDYFGQYNDDGEEHGIGIYQAQPYYNPEKDLYEKRHIYAGQFNNNTAEGIGIKIYNNYNAETELYCGEYKQDKRNGIGCTKFPTGAMFIGEHKNHIINGFGVFITWEKLKFIGRCYIQCPTQEGKWYDKNDNEIDIIKLGYNKFGIKYGRETKIWPCGGKYTGSMRNHKAHGVGTKSFSNGSKYTGFWKNGEMEGQGTMTYAFGDTYIGRWKNGFHHGQGTYTSLDGRTFVGEFKKGREWNGNVYRK